MKTDKPIIDFTSLPVGEVAMILRSLGQRLFLAALGGETRPDICEVLSDQDVSTLANSNIWRTPLARRMRQSQRNLRMDLPNGLKTPIEKAWAGNLTSSQWRTRVRDRLAQAFGGGACQILPDAFWPLVAQMAWNDLSFREEILQASYESLKHELPLMSGTPHQLTLNPGCFWTLILLTSDQTPFSAFLSGHRERVGVVSALRRAAASQLITAGWAGFWDQWLIQRALKNWPQAVDELDRVSRRILAGLPLIKDALQVPTPGFLTRMRRMSPKRKLFHLFHAYLRGPTPRMSLNHEFTAASSNWLDEAPEPYRSCVLAVNE